MVVLGDAWANTDNTNIINETYPNGKYLPFPDSFHYWAGQWYDTYTSFSDEKWYARGSYEKPGGSWYEQEFNDWAAPRGIATDYPWYDTLDLDGDGAPEFYLVFFDADITGDDLDWSTQPSTA